jgi:hypothetical protein
MFPQGIDAVRLKVERARFHNDQAQAKWDEFIGSGAYGYVMSMDAEPPHTLRFRWQLRERTAEDERVLVDLALMFSDLMGNLRSALDHLAWQLVKVAGNEPHGRTSFPTAKSLDAWNSARGSAVRGIALQWLAVIDELQPYRETRPERHLLAVLDEVNNLAKHRMIPPTAQTLGEFGFKYSSLELPGRAITRNSIPGEIVSGEEFFNITANPPLDNVNVRLRDPIIRYSFTDGLNHDDGWGYTNADLIEWVSNAIDRFEPAFQ